MISSFYSGREVLLQHHWPSEAALGYPIVFVVSGTGEDSIHSMFLVNSQTTGTHIPSFHPELCFLGACSLKISVCGCKAREVDTGVKISLALIKQTHIGPCDDLSSISFPKYKSQYL